MKFDLAECLFVVGIILLCILFGGKPDIADAIIEVILR